MSTIITDDGLNWIANRASPDESTAELQYVAVGTGTAVPASDDTGLAVESYRSDIDSTNSSISRSSNTGAIRASITISGGTEVESGAEITEIGIYTATDDLVYREVRDVITVENGERVTFEFTVTFIN